MKIITILSMFTSLGVLFKGATGFLRIFAVADITIGTIDLALSNEELKNALIKSGPAGKWFVDNWGTISLTLSLGMLTKQLAEGLIKNGPKLKAWFTKRGNKKMADQMKELTNKAKKELGLKQKLLLNESPYLKTSARFAKKVSKTLDKAPSRIKNYEDSIRHHDSEWIGCYNSLSGKFSHKAGAGKHSVEFPVEYRSKYSIITHNHPLDTGISIGDIKTFIITLPEEIRAVVRNGEVFSLKNKGLNISDRKNLIINFKKIRIKYKEKFNALTTTKQNVGESIEKTNTRLQFKWDDLLDEQFKEVFGLIKDKVEYTHYIN